MVPRGGVAAEVGERPRQSVSVSIKWKQKVGIRRGPAASAHTLPLHLLQLGKSSKVGEGKTLLAMMMMLALIFRPAHLDLSPFLISADIADQVRKGEASSSSSNGGR